MMQQRGWTLLFHEGVIAQLRKLRAAAERAEQNDPQGFENNANAKLFRALSQLIMEVVPSDPARGEFANATPWGRRTATGRAQRSDGCSAVLPLRLQD